MCLRHRAKIQSVTPTPTAARIFDEDAFVNEIRQITPSPSLGCFPNTQVLPGIHPTAKPR